MKSNWILILALFLVFVTCRKDDDNLASGSKLLIGKEYFNGYPKDPFLISNAEISGDILTITFSASCCSTENWVTNLVGSETILYSDTPQREIRLSFKNSAITCDMLCGKTVQFDLTPAKLDNTNTLKLILDGWGSQLSYNY
jgi:hypothetical protein